MSDDWDNEDFEPPPIPAPRRADDRWEGEDEEEPVKDSWEDEEEEQKPATDEKPKEEKPSAAKNKKKKLEEKIAEKERKRLEELEKKNVENGDEDLEDLDLTPEERLAEKLRRQKLQEEADLLMARDTFGIGDAPASGVLDSLNPSSKEDFLSAKDALVNKIKEWQARPGFSEFAEELIRDVCTILDVEALKKVSLVTKAFHEEKLKMSKQVKGKSKGKKTVALKVDKDDAFYNDDYGEYDDFI